MGAKGNERESDGRRATQQKIIFPRYLLSLIRLSHLCKRGREREDMGVRARAQYISGEWVFEPCTIACKMLKVNSRHARFMNE